MHFNHILSLFPTPPRIITQVHVLSLKKKKTKNKANQGKHNKTSKNENQIRQTKKSKTNKQMNNKRKIPKQNTKHPQTESNLCWSTGPGCGACPGVWLIYPVSLRRRKLISPFPADINRKQLLG